MTKIAGKLPQFQRADLYNSIGAGRFPEYDLKVQLFPDNDAFMYKNYDLLDPTIVVPSGKSSYHSRNYDSQSQSDQLFRRNRAGGIQSTNVVTGITFVPDPVISWRLLAHDETHHYRHGSRTLSDGRHISTSCNNNFRDGLMQMYLYEGNSASTPNGIGGVQEASGPKRTAMATKTSTDVSDAMNSTTIPLRKRQSYSTHEQLLSAAYCECLSPGDWFSCRSKCQDQLRQQSLEFH